jgi:transposase-like protein
MDSLPQPTTLLEAVKAFSDPQVAHDYFVAIRWPHGVIGCPRPGCGETDVVKIANRNVWRCRVCDRQFTAKVGTVFEDSPIGFDKWLPAMWMLSSCRNGVSSCELARHLHVTQKTAWFMLHRLRLSMKTPTFEQLEGEIEADETYVGGKPRHDSPWRTRKRTRALGPAEGKATVMGLIRRGGPVRAFVVKDNRKNTLLPRIEGHVKRGATVYTDSLMSYRGVQERYVHHVINHSIAYVRGRVHTNSIENFWSVLRRTLGGTYVAPRPKHLDRYLDEQVFRFNHREERDGERFPQAFRNADGNRLTYKALTAKEERL